MSITSKYPRISVLVSAGTLLANCLVWGCSPQPPRYPSVVYDVPRCYDSREDLKKNKKCKDISEDVYLNLDYLKSEKTDSELWIDILAILDKPETKFWRLNIFRVVDGEWQEGILWQSSKSERTARFTKLPLEVLLRAEFEFCSSETSNDCDGASAKIESRNINFLKHLFPEPELKTKT